MNEPDMTHRWKVLDIIIRYEMAVAERNLQRGELFWPDLSDIATQVVKELDVHYWGTSNMPALPRPPEYPESEWIDPLTEPQEVTDDGI